DDACRLRRKLQRGERRDTRDDRARADRGAPGLAPHNGEIVMKPATAALALLSVLACASLRAEPMFRGDAAHSGVYPGHGPRQFHRIKWTFPTGDRLGSSPVYRDGVIYFGGDDGNVYAVGAKDGRQRWKRATGGPVASTPAISGDTLYIASYDGKLYALAPAT